MKKYTVVLSGSRSYYTEIEVDAEDGIEAENKAYETLAGKDLPWKDPEGSEFTGNVYDVITMDVIPVPLAGLK